MANRDLNLALVIRARDETGGILDRLGSTLKFFGVMAAAAATSAAVMSVSAGKEFARFEQEMLNVQAASGATAQEFQLLKKAALDASAATRFDPTQTGQALYTLASAGMSAKDSITALQPVLNLASATHAGLEQSTENVTMALGAFNLTADQTARIADVFTAAVSASSLNADRLTVALRNSAPTANAMNQSLEETVGALAVLSNSFNNGEAAGTGLRSLLMELNANAAKLGITVRDENTGAFRPLYYILRDMERAGWNANKAITTFGADAGPALAILLSAGSGALDRMTMAVRSSGQAAETAETQNSGLEAALDKLGSAYKTAKDKFGEHFAPGMKQAVESLTELLTSNSAVKFLEELGDKASQAAQWTVEKIKDIINSQEEWQASLSRSIEWAKKELPAFVQAMTRAFAAIKEWIDKDLPTIILMVDRVVVAINKMIPGIEAVGSVVAFFLTELVDLGTTAGIVAANIVLAFGKIIDFWKQAIDWELEKAKQAIDAIENAYYRMRRAVSSAIEWAANIFSPSITVSGAPTTTIKDYAPSYDGYATGTSYIPRDGLVMAHQGERIVSNNSTSIGDINLSLSGGSGGVPSRNEWRKIVRAYILPELVAARR